MKEQSIAESYLGMSYQIVKASSERLEFEDGAVEYVFEDESFIVFDWLNGKHSAHDKTGTMLKIL